MFSSDCWSTAGRWSTANPPHRMCGGRNWLSWGLLCWLLFHRWANQRPDRRRGAGNLDQHPCEVWTVQAGVTGARVGDSSAQLEDTRKCAVPGPSLAEQRRIVGKVGEVDALEAAMGMGQGERGGCWGGGGRRADRHLIVGLATVRTTDCAKHIVGTSADDHSRHVELGGRQDAAIIV